MTSNWTNSRTARKFFRHKLAVAALVIIAIYFCVAIAVLCGAITLRDTEERVGMQNEPGFFLEPDPEKRLEDCEVLIEGVERALQRDDPKVAISEIQFGRVGVAAEPLDELAKRVESGWTLYDALASSEDLDDDPQMLLQLEQLEEMTGQLYPHPAGWEGLVQSMLLSLGTDRQGRSILLRAVYSVKVAIQIGVVTALISVFLGSLIGCAAAFFGGWVDHAVIWLYTTFSSIPNLVLLVLLAYMFTGTIFDGTLIPVYVAFCSTFWIGPCRVIRGETMKIKELEYVQAATAVGFRRFYVMLYHILPNAAHLMLVNFSLLFIGAIKSEVILSFLGLGVKEGPSWGIMISQSSHEVVTGFFWQIGATTAFMFVLVLAFNVLSDALQDAFDPKHL
jgi:peptide/nickel transport system permease protein